MQPGDRQPITRALLGPAPSWGHSCRCLSGMPSKALSVPSPYLSATQVTRPCPQGAWLVPSQPPRALGLRFEPPSLRALPGLSKVQTQPRPHTCFSLPGPPLDPTYASFSPEPHPWPRPLDPGPWSSRQANELPSSPAAPSSHPEVPGECGKQKTLVQHQLTICLTSVRLPLWPFLLQNKLGVTSRPSQGAGVMRFKGNKQVSCRITNTHRALGAHGPS